MAQIEEVFTSEETVALAKEKARKMLGVSEEEIDFEILQTPEKKVLGVFGGKMAQVKAIIKKSPKKYIEKFIKDLLFSMGFGSLNVKITSENKDVCNFQIDGSAEELQCIIGHHGETLDSIQYLAGLIANKNNKSDSFFKIRIEAGNYREKRKEALEILAKKIAQKVISNKNKVSLEPMRSYERMIVHSIINNIDGVKSWSEGEAKNRHIIVVPD